MGDSKEWYTNKELFEQLVQLRNDNRELSSEMKETRRIIKQYNGLREEVGRVNEKVVHVEEQLETLQAEAKGRSSVWKGIREWGGWLVGILGLILAAASKIF